MTASAPYDTISTTTRSAPIFTKCCFCIPLRIGCFLLGYINLVLNTFHTIALLILTTYIGISTHGFDHFDKRGPDQVQNQLPEQVQNQMQVQNQIQAMVSPERPFLNQIGILLMAVLCSNVAWLLINIACLVGLHKRKPGPIRVYVGCATARLLLSLAGFVYLSTAANANTQTLVTHSADLSLAAYFILVYYIYAAQLERERVQAQEKCDVSAAPTDVVFAYPTKTDKQILVA